MAKKQQPKKPPIPPMDSGKTPRMPKMPPTADEHNAMLERMRQGKKK
jgi:hypothetical protein